MPANLPLEAQKALIETSREGVRQAPLHVPATPRTGEESVRMTNCGILHGRSPSEPRALYRLKSL